MPDLAQQTSDGMVDSPASTLPRSAKKRGKLKFQTPIASIVAGQSETPNSAEIVKQTDSGSGTGVGSVNSVTTPNRSFIRMCQKARRVRFFRNGDQYFKVRRLSVSDGWDPLSQMIFSSLIAESNFCLPRKTKFLTMMGLWESSEPYFTSFHPYLRELSVSCADVAIVSWEPEKINEEKRILGYLVCNISGTLSVVRRTARRFNSVDGWSD